MKGIGKLAKATRSVAGRVPIAIAYPLRLVPWDSTVIGPPKGVVNSACGSWGEVRTLPLEHINVDQIDTLDPGIAAAFRTELRRSPVIPHVTLLRNGRAAEPCAAIITDSDEVAGDLCRPLGGFAESHPIFGRLKLPRLKRYPGSVAVLHGQRTDNYFHWIFEAIGRLALLQAAGVSCESYLVEAGDQVRTRSLDELGISESMRISPREVPHISAERLAVPSRLPSGLVPPSVVQFLRARFSPANGVSAGRRLYVSRRNASRRRMRHEGEISSTLREMGFEEIRCETLSFNEQVEAFGQASIVVGPHGAGLSNIVFCPRNALLVECFAADYLNPCYATVASAAGIRYAAIADGNVDPDRQPVHGRSDISIRGDVLRHFLQKHIG